MPGITALRALAGFSAANFPAHVSGSMSKNLAKAQPIRFKGQLIDEVNPKDRRKMDLIDEFARNEPLSSEQRRHYESYLVQYEDLNDDLQHGLEKKAVLGLIGRRIEQMWENVPEKYKLKFRQSLTEALPPRRYSSSRLNQIESSRPETIPEEP